MRAYKVKLSGSYRSADGDVIDYQGLEGYIPFSEEEKVAAAAIKRYALMWLSDSPKYPKSIKVVREVFIDYLEFVEEHRFSFVKKNIKDLTFPELQDLAVAKDLRAIPLYKAGSLKNAQQLAYVEYANKVLGKDYDHREEGFNFHRLPNIVINDDWQINHDESSPTEQVMEDEFAGKKTLSFEDLKKIAKDKNIEFSPNIGYGTIYKRVFA